MATPGATDCLGWPDVDRHYRTEMGGKPNSRCRVGNWFWNFLSLSLPLSISLSPPLSFWTWNYTRTMGRCLNCGGRPAGSVNDMLAGAVIIWQDWWGRKKEFRGMYWHSGAALWPAAVFLGSTRAAVGWPWSTASWNSYLTHFSPPFRLFYHNGETVLVYLMAHIFINYTTMLGTTAVFKGKTVMLLRGCH